MKKFYFVCSGTSFRCQLNCLLVVSFRFYDWCFFTRQRPSCSCDTQSLTCRVKSFIFFFNMLLSVLRWHIRLHQLLLRVFIQPTHLCYSNFISLFHFSSLHLIAHGIEMNCSKWHWEWYSFDTGVRQCLISGCESIRSGIKTLWNIHT